MRKLVFLMIALLMLTACEALPAIEVVPTTSDSSQDDAAAQSLLPNLSGQGYTSHSATSIVEALASIGESGSALSGNLAVTAAIAKIDDLIQCYEGVGAVAAQVYTRADIGDLLQGDIPKVGTLAVVNRDRISRNLLPCALNTGERGFSAQSAEIEPCGGSGTLERGGETLDYIYAATDPQLCTLFSAALR
jgi:hypothetical protein